MTTENLIRKQVVQIECLTIRDEITYYPELGLVAKGGKSKCFPTADSAKFFRELIRLYEKGENKPASYFYDLFPHMSTHGLLPWHTQCNTVLKAIGATFQIVRPKRFSAIDRYHLLDDTFALEQLVPKSPTLGEPDEFTFQPLSTRQKNGRYRG